MAISLKYANAYKEVIEILKYIPEKYVRIIPKEKIEWYKENMNINYNFKIQTNEKIEEKEFSIEAASILANLYTDYWATEDEREIIERFDAQKIEENIRQKCNPDEIFKRKNVVKSGEVNDIQLIEYKETVFTKIKNIIFRILHIKNNG